MQICRYSIKKEWNNNNNIIGNIQYELEEESALVSSMLFEYFILLFVAIIATPELPRNIG